MGDCSDKIKTRCKKVSSECVSYDRDLPESSELTSCATIGETVEELYGVTETIKSEIDLTSLEEDCLTLPVTNNVKIMFQFLITTICGMKEEIDALQTLTTTHTQQITALQEEQCP